MRDDYIGLYKQLFDANENLARAYCAGEGWTAEYGWPIGDQIPETMADDIIRRLKTVQ